MDLLVPGAIREVLAGAGLHCLAGKVAAGSSLTSVDSSGYQTSRVCIYLQEPDPEAVSAFLRN